MGMWSVIIRVESGISVNAVGCRSSAVGPSSDESRSVRKEFVGQSKGDAIDHVSFGETDGRAK